MEKIQAPKTDNVVCWRRGQSVRGTLHLTQHHLIFRYKRPNPAQGKEFGETWIAYPMINHCSYRPSPIASHQPPALRIRCRDFNYMAFHFDQETEARAVFENVRNLTCRLGHVDKLYAFSYPSSARERQVKGWDIYDPRKEFARMGISSDNKTSGWRISTINSAYQYCDTYPALLCVPSTISDNTLKYTASFRSKCRIPALSYKYALNGCTITRSAQPNVGVRLSRSAQDEKLVGAIFNSTRPSGARLSLPTTPKNNRSASDLTSDDDLSSDLQTLNAGLDESNEHGEIAQPSSEPIETSGEDLVKVYGAQQINMIIDARPSVNAMAQHARGYGSERMEGYKNAQKAFMGIDNIHVMRRSLAVVVDALKDSDLTTFPPNQTLLEKSRWRTHISLLLEGTRVIANTIAIQHSHVLIHCSDGWDRTSQLSALSQLCLDPYYRTIDGIIVLIEKDWLSFGFMFRHRAGLLGYDKWFEIENDRSSSIRNNGDDSTNEGEPTGNVFENALSQAQKFLRARSKLPDDDSDVETMSTESSPAPKGRQNAANMEIKSVDETSPVFHQFLDCVYQLLRQFPTQFEFNERFLRRVLYHSYSCQYGTFLYNSEKERKESKASERTRSVWEYILSRRDEFSNKLYDPEIDEKVKEKASLLIPNAQDVRWWYELYNRTDEELNGRNSPPPPTHPGQVLEGTESQSDSLENSQEGEFGSVSNTSSLEPTATPITTTEIPSTDLVVEEPTTLHVTATTPPTNDDTAKVFARIDAPSLRHPLAIDGDDDDVTVLTTLANMDSSRAGTPKTETQKNYQWTSGLSGKTTSDPLDVEMS